MFPRRIDLIILICFSITFVNELTLDLNVIEKLFLADDSGFFAIGLLFYEHHRGRRDSMLYSLLGLAIATALFQAVHRIPKLEAMTGATFDSRVVVAICVVAIAAIFQATRIRRIPVAPSVLIAIGGLTYPLYLLHMQMGYTILLSGIVPGVGVVDVAAILTSIVLLSWAVWRYVDLPAQAWTKLALTTIATRIGWPSRLGQHA